MDDDISQSHSYGTRKSHNLTIRPAPRLRSSPPPARRLRHSPDLAFPQFPPHHVVLHPDDAGSKVFIAIGRAFLSVDNRAMTIKDLAEMVLSFGLVAQNVSAASQAITTYIRTHLQRCDSQQDIPLLLRHVLSGTDADDDLLPALYSRSGGAQCSAHPENRVTNFRRGTMVWYLSRATGASCPFARAGIRLCDYGENGKTGQSGNVAREKKRAKMLQRLANDQACGQKRKRSLRSCATATAVRDSATESESDHDKPPPKVKLTLRLKPLAKCTSPSSSTPAPTNVRNIIDLTTHAEPSSSSTDSESDSSMSIDDSDSEPQTLLHCAEQPEEPPLCPPPYPRRSISIPPYTPSSSDEPYSTYPATTQLYKELYRRSPSLAYSTTSPPPESDDEEEEEEEEEEIQSPTARSRRNYYSFSDDDDEEDDDWDEEGEVDSEADGETLWESPGPRSPSAPLPEAKVKEEPRDVQGMLDAWDHFDSSVADARVVEVIAQAAAVLNPDTIGGSVVAASRVKVESQDPWDWEPPLAQQHDWMLGIAEETIRIKQEELDLGIDSLFPSVGDDSFELEDEGLDQHSPDVPTINQRAKTAPLSHVSSIFTGSASIPPLTTRTATPTEPISSIPHPLTLPPPISPGAAALVQLIQALSVQSPTTPTASSLPPPPDPPTEPCSIVPAPPTVPPSSLVLSPTSPTFPAQQPCVSPQAMKVNFSSCKGDAEGIVVHTCQPCNPSISATQIEEISVYQMMLGPYLLSRRIDTDFVNLTPIVEWCGKGRGYPVLSTVPNAMVVGRGWGSEKVVGVWVPLEVAQSYVKDLDTFSVATMEGEKEKDEVMEGLDVFLSDELVERFPDALKDFHRTNSSGRMLKQFGRWFESMVTFAHTQATVAANASASTSSTTTSATSVAVASCATSSGPLNPQKVMQADPRQSWMQKETVVPVTGAFALGAVLAIGEREKLQHHHQRQDSGSLSHRRTSSSGFGLKQEEDRLDCASPLSAKEQEMFQELCIIPGEEEERMKVEEEDCKMGVEGVVCVVGKREEEEDIPKVVVSGSGGLLSVVNVSVEPTMGVEDVDVKPSSTLEVSRPLNVVQKPSTPSTELIESKASQAVPVPTTRTRPARAATTSKLYEKQEQEPERVDRSQTLRRSKRVAAAAQTQQSSQNSSQQQQQQEQKTRVRKRPGSRNTLS